MEFELKKTLLALLHSTNEPLSIKDVQAVITRYHEQAEQLLAEQEEDGDKPASADEDGQGIMRDLLDQVPSLLTSAQIRDAMSEIAEELKESEAVYRLREGPNGYRLAVSSRFADWVRLLRDEPRPQRLSPAAMETLWGGRTLGKAAMGLRVVTREGAPERFRHAAIRAMVGLVEIYVLLGIPAVISIVVSRRDQRLGDLVAGTLVLRQRAGRRATPPVVFGVPWNWEGYVQGLDVSPLSEEQYGVVRAVLLRCAELSPAARWQVTTEVATMVAGRMCIPVPVQVAPEMFLTCVATAYQRRTPR